MVVLGGGLSLVSEVPLQFANSKQFLKVERRQGLFVLGSKQEVPRGALFLMSEVPL